MAIGGSSSCLMLVSLLVSLRKLSQEVTHIVFCSQVTNTNTNTQKYIVGLTIGQSEQTSLRGHTLI